jgi:hypothetical protein
LYVLRQPVKVASINKQLIGEENRRITMKCKNCGKEIQVKYCSYCGQEVIKERLSIGELARKFIETITHAEQGIFRLVKELCLKPGVVSREYIDGRRKKYFSPIKYLIIVVSVSAIVVVNFEGYGIDYEPTFSEESKIDDIVEQKYFNHNYYKYLLFLSIPLAALVTRVVFRRSGNNYAEDLVLNTYVLSQVVLFHTIIVTPLLIFSSSLDDWIILIYLILSALYIIFAYMQFYRGKRLKVLLQSVTALALFTMLHNLISHYMNHLK